MNNQLKRVLQRFETTIKYTPSDEQAPVVNRLEQNLSYLQGQRTLSVSERRTVNELLNTITIHAHHDTHVVIDDLMQSIDLYHKREGFNLYTELSEQLGFEYE